MVTSYPTDPEPGELEQDAIGHLTTQGYAFMDTELSRYWQPMTVGYNRSGTPFWLLVVSQESVDPGSYLDWTALAIQNGFNVVIVTAGSNAAKRVAGPLENPVQLRRDDDIELIETPVMVQTDDDEIPLAPADTDRISWMVTPEQSLKLEIDETPVTEGPLQDGVSSFDYDCPRARQRNGTYAVVDDSGSDVDRYDSLGELKRDYTPVTAPHVPTRHSYAGHAEIWYHTPNGMFQFESDAPWADQEMKQRVTRAVESLYMWYLFDQPGAQIDAEEFYTAFERYYTAKTSKPCPDRDQFADIMDHWAPGFSDTGSLDGYDWVLPPRCDAPDCFPPRPVQLSSR